MKKIYLDNAATSFPKAPGVSGAMKTYIDEIGANINRSVYEAAQSAELTVLSLRERAKRVFNFPHKSSHVVITPGNTAALNTIIKGFLSAGDHVLVSAMEHNAVMRPLVQMGAAFDRVPCSENGVMDVNAIEPLIRAETKLFILCHASNVSGTLQDALAAGEICARHNIPFVLDAAQSAGHIQVDFEALHLAALSAPGHKGLLGPQGIGLLLMTHDFARKISPLIAGGTGSASHTEITPEFMPDKFEAGTANIPGIYGLEAALAFIEKTGIDALRRHEAALTEQFINGLTHVKNVKLCGTCDIEKRVGVISLDFANIDNADASRLLDEKFNILTRCGLHCAPSAHKTLGTYPRGTVRFSIGYANTPHDIDDALCAIEQISKA